MQGLWNIATAVMEQRIAPIIVTNIEGMFVSHDLEIEPKRVHLNARTMSGTCNDAALRCLHIPYTECLARSNQKAKLVAWYSKECQTSKHPEKLNERASRVMQQPMYGPIVLTGETKKYQYTSCPPIQLEKEEEEVVEEEVKEEEEEEEMKAPVYVVVPEKKRRRKKRIVRKQKRRRRKK